MPLYASAAGAGSGTSSMRRYLRTGMSLPHIVAASQAFGVVAVEGTDCVALHPVQRRWANHLDGGCADLDGDDLQILKGEGVTKTADDVDRVVPFGWAVLDHRVVALEILDGDLFDR